ncbi:hypothetical protein [Arthrobacter sp. CP30]
MTTQDLRKEVQLNPVADEVSAITAVVGPILRGILYSLRKDVAERLGGYEQVPLFMLPRSRREGDGDTGICFEYALHDAVTRGEASVQERVVTALKLCKIPSTDVSSILFGVEKAGSQQIIDTAESLLTKDSVLMTGTKGRPVALKRHISKVASSMRVKGDRSRLPQSIDGLWKADLFLGNPDSEKWVGTTVKINPSKLEASRGLRLGLVPASEGKDDRVRLDESKNLVVCPVPYDGAFVEVFYKAWEVVVAFLVADAKLPKEVNLPRPAARQVARYLADRSNYPVVEVIESISALAQPELIRTDVSPAGLVTLGLIKTEPNVPQVLAPSPIGLNGL